MSSILLGIGTGVCGAAAIAATSPILKSKEKDIAIKCRYYCTSWNYICTYLYSYRGYF
ncbi:putative sulfate exporter family transporter [Streptococcus pneumoniae]|uniref:putative sulfate exporter family transporter n=1 Tax=Streptococcus pneumoniae TaxID=1313 RepID=UPI0039806B12